MSLNEECFSSWTEKNQERSKEKLEQNQHHFIQIKIVFQKKIERKEQAWTFANEIEIRECGVHVCTYVLP